MLRFSANLSMLFGEYDFLARFEKAAQCGFRGVEFMFPYDYDIEELKHVLAGNDSNLLIVFYVQIMPDDFVMQLHRF
ncbi:hydroxypyruvate isomerase [Escherichia coli]|nr:hydroxypyruvate isomerase [Escherichia coli]